MKKYKYLIAVSGGPDSMNLLSKFKKKKILVAHVNYNSRAEDSKKDLELVESYCLKNKISFEFLNVDQEINQKYDYIKNLESKYRKIRYDFFENLLLKYEIEILLIAHNKDDFLETAIMQYKRDKSFLKLFYGLESPILKDFYKIEKPLLKLWKKDILEENNRENIPFRIDKTNNDLGFERNKIRYLLLNKSIFAKEEMIDFFYKLNLRNDHLFKNNQNLFKEWKKTNFEISFFNDLKYKNKLVLIYWFLNNESNDYLKLSKGKIESIIDFINAKNNSKSFLLNNRINLIKKDNKLIIINNL